jgi:serine/threonine protein kinase
MPYVPPTAAGITTVRDLLVAGPLGTDQALTISVHLATGMRFAQQRVPGVVHGDLKPENLLLLDGSVLISDFGLASVASDSTIEELESTWAYRAPECWDRRATAAADVYAFGIVVYELLTGNTPFFAESRDAWAAGHRTAAVPVPPEFELDNAPSTLMRIARQCLRSQDNRPATFDAVLNLLWGIVQDFDVQLANQLNEDQRSTSVLFQEARPTFDEIRVKNLIALQEPRLALQEIDRISRKFLTPRMRFLRGSVLSLCDRDLDALREFDAALRSGLNVNDEMLCRSEYALSLKRLGKIQEAADMLESLLAVAPKSQRYAIAANLSSVYLEADRADDALAQLRRACLEKSDSWKLWAMMGLAQEQLGQYNDAAMAYRRAHSIAPHEAQPRDLLAAVMMDHLDDPLGALLLLRLGAEQGTLSWKELVRYMACHVLLDLQEEASSIEEAARDRLGPAQADAFLHEVGDLIEHGVQHREASASGSADLDKSRRPHGPSLESPS